MQRLCEIDDVYYYPIRDQFWICKTFLEEEYYGFFVIDRHELKKIAENDWSDISTTTSDIHHTILDKYISNKTMVRADSKDTAILLLIGAM